MAYHGGPDQNQSCLVQGYRVFLIVAIKVIFPLFMAFTVFMVPDTAVYTLLWAIVCILLFAAVKNSSELISFALPALVTLVYVCIWAPVYSAGYTHIDPPPALLLYCAPFFCLILFSNIGSTLRSKIKPYSTAAHRKKPNHIRSRFIADEQKQKRFWKTLGIISGSVLVIAIAVSISISAYNQAKQYGSAEALVAEKRFSEAQQAFYALEDYRDSRSRAESLQSQVLANAQSGDIVTFGTYRSSPITWIVLKRDGDKLYVLSEKCLDYRTRVGTEGDVDYSLTPIVTYGNWDTSKLRIWLNDTFLNTAFTKEEQSQILETRVTSDKYQRDSGNPSKQRYIKSVQTTDRLFLLSAREVREYTAQSQAMYDLIYDAAANYPGAPTGEGNDVYPEWALIDTGYYFVSYSTYDEKYYLLSGKWLENEAHVRPVMWISAAG